MPQTTTGESPAQLRWGRSPRSHLDLLRPNVGTKVSMAQARQTVQHDQHSRSRKLAVGDTVQVRNYSGTRKWRPGMIVEETGPVSAKVELEDGIIVRRQLLARPTQPMEHQVSQPIPTELGSEAFSQVIPPVIVVQEPKTTAAKSEATGFPPSTDPVTVETPERRYPRWEHKPPSRFQ